MHKIVLEFFFYLITKRIECENFVIRNWYVIKSCVVNCDKIVIKSDKNVINIGISLLFIVYLNESGSNV